MHPDEKSACLHVPRVLGKIRVSQQGKGERDYIEKMSATWTAQMSTSSGNLPLFAE